MAEDKQHAFGMIRAVLGLLLLGTAGAKLLGLSVSAVPSVRWFSSPWVQVAAIQWEIILAAWLLSGKAPGGAWTAATSTFALLAGISGYLGWVGQATCGCLGVIKVSPWYVFAGDLACLLLLAVGYPGMKVARSNQRVNGWNTVSWGASFVLGVGVVFGCLALVGTWLYGSPRAALARVRGQALTVNPEYVDCGSGKPGERLEGGVEVFNWTDRPVRLVGGTSDCSCVTTVGLPITISPGQSRTIPLRLKVPASAPGAFTRDAVLFTDCDQQRAIRLRVGCLVE